MKAYKGGKRKGSKDQPQPNRLQAINQHGIPPILTIPNQSEHKYSAMLLELIRPYMTAQSDVDEADHMLMLGMYAWNLANLKKELPEAHTAMNQDLKETLKGNKKALKQLISMISDKEKKFGEDKLYIVEYEIHPSKGSDVNVVTRSGTLEVFLVASFMGEVGEDYYNDEPAYINRTAVMVKIREPFIAWLKEIDDSISPYVDVPEPNIYLFDIKESIQATESWLKENFDRIFSKELEEWFADESSWPKHRSFEMFCEWFEFTYHPLVYDLENHPVDKDLL